MEISLRNLYHPKERYSRGVPNKGEFKKISKTMVDKSTKETMGYNTTYVGESQQGGS